MKRTLGAVLWTTAILCAIFASAVHSQDSTEIDSTVTDGKAADSLVVINLEDGGTIRLEFIPDNAPGTVKRIKELVSSGFYDGLEFHRVESYLVQTGKKEHDYPNLPGEMFSQYIKHEPGMVGMARLPNDYDSATTQFYICKKAIPSINGEYTIFARVVEGMDLVNSIEEGDRIESCRISAGE